MSRAGAARRGLLLLTLAATTACSVTTAAPVREGLDVGDRPPAFALQDLAGTVHSLEGHHGKLVLLHFWATWCPYCRGEIPKLTAIHEQWAEEGVVVLAVSVDQDPAALRQFVAQHGLAYPVIAEIEANVGLARQYRVQGIPTTYLIGPDGLVLDHVVGPTDLLGAVRRVVANRAGDRA